LPISSVSLSHLTIYSGNKICSSVSQYSTSRLNLKCQIIHVFFLSKKNSYWFKISIYIQLSQMFLEQDHWTFPRTRPLNISFRRLVNANLHSCHESVLRIANIYLNDEPNIFRWSLRSSGQFLVSSMYQTLLDLDIIPHNIFLWKLKIPLKIKVFLGLLYKKVILTNLVK
jgi:hypothetical protein